MQIETSITISGIDFELIDIHQSEDAVNQFFYFDVTIRHQYLDKIAAIALQSDGLLTFDTLNYQFEVERMEQTLVQPNRHGSQQDHLARLLLRPKGWQILKHKHVRVFETGSEIDDPLNYYFNAVPDEAALTRLLHLLAFDENEQCQIGLLANADIYDFRLDWWQNQLALQLQEDNESVFKRITYKAGASFFYSAHSNDHKFIVLPDICPVSQAPQTLQLDDISELTRKSVSRNEFQRWSEDVFTGALRGNITTDFIDLSQANLAMDYQFYELKANRPLACDYPLKIDLDDQTLVVMPIKVTHSYSHRHGYQASVLAISASNGEYFDLAGLDQAPKSFNQTIFATVHSKTGAKIGDRDYRYRYLVQFDYQLEQNGVVYRPSAWLHNTRSASGIVGEGDFSPLASQSKVLVQMINGDREQPIITAAFLTHMAGV